MRKNVSFSIIGIGVVAVLLLGLATLEQPNVGTSTIIEPTQTLIIPETSSTQLKTETITPTNFAIQPEHEKISVSSVNSNNDILQNAHAVTSGQLDGLLQNYLMLQRMILTSTTPMVKMIMA